MKTNNGEHNYLDILENLVENGERKENRTGIDTLALPPQTLVHDMATGFPLLTTKRIPFRLVASELEFFIKGLRIKSWLQERDNHIWDEWGSPSKVNMAIRNAGLDPDNCYPETRKQYQAQENDLGPVYGVQWRNFNLNGCDQLTRIVQTLKSNPNDRRMVCTAWNPLQLNDMALPACHLMWIVNHINGKLHLQWTQRSCDMGLGIPFNLASYALLLHLLCKESGFEPGTVTGTLVDCHLYVNHIDQIREQLSRSPTPLPTITTKNWNNIFEWEYTDTEIIGYNPQPSIRMDVAV
jgi:thymidylate synthase